MNVKDIIIKPITAKSANEFIKQNHYSGKIVNNSQLHLGAFFKNRLGGVLQFGPSMMKDLIKKLVKNTGWNEFIELNRMAFADWMPKNSESRSIAVCIKIIKKNYPHIKWIISFADGCQCGDGTIYRASGFALTGIKKNSQLAINPKTGEVQHKISAYHRGEEYQHAGWKKLSGFQLRYIYFIDRKARDRLTVPILPFSEIQRRGASMYKGKPRASSAEAARLAVQPGGGGSSPTDAHQV
jgi:hypothetical protein